MKTTKIYHFIQCKLREYIKMKMSATMLLTITENGEIISMGTIKNVPKTENKLYIIYK